MNSKKLNRLKVKAYRDAYISSQIDQGLAYQIRALREARGWGQKELAKKIGLRSQSAIARMEDPSYGKFSITSLKRLSKAFDVGMLIKFVPYSRILTETENLSPEHLNAKSFAEEEKELEQFVDTTSACKVYFSANGTVMPPPVTTGTTGTSLGMKEKPFFGQIAA